MVAIFGDAIARPAEQVALRSSPARAYRKRGLRKSSRLCAGLIKSPNVGCATYSNPKAFCRVNRSPSYPTAVITVRELPAFLHPRSEHILDWFHIGMRIEQLMQTARGARSTATGVTKDLLLKELARVKWFLWHGNVVRADDTLSNLIDDLDGVREEDREAGRPPQLVLKKLSRALEEFGAYTENNVGAIVNYGERRRRGERISTRFVESTINQLIAKRFVKKQQMRWTPRGAHTYYSKCG